VDLHGPPDLGRAAVLRLGGHQKMSPFTVSPFQENLDTAVNANNSRRRKGLLPGSWLVRARGLSRGGLG
jgi:hypothetical protein